MRIVRICVIAAMLAGLALQVARAQAPQPGNYSAAQFGVHESLGNRVPMRDGVFLSVDIYSPRAPGRYPAVLTITPYNNNGGWQARAKWFAQRGYVAVVADTRGRYDSDGVWDPYNPAHKSDGYDLVEWIARQIWCTGRVGVYGPSYMGYETWWTATQAPPSLMAIVPEVAPADPTRGGPYQDGVMVGRMFDWSAMVSGRTNQVAGEGPAGGFTARRRGEPIPTPYTALNRVYGVVDPPWFPTWMRNNLSSAEYWKAIAYQTPESYSKVTVPSLAATGWFDSAQSGSPLNYTAMKQYGATAEARRPRLVIGPWTHWPIATRQAVGIDYGADAAIDWDGYVTRFLDHYLKGIDNGVEHDPPVHVFVMGANTWRAEKDWPLPQTQWTRYYLASQGKANLLAGDGLLTVTPSEKDASDTYIYDPARPTRLPSLSDYSGPMDTRPSALGAEVLVYQTPPLTSAVEVVGPIEATLYAATSARDTDWYVRLADVGPDGRSLLLAEGALRARSRDPDNGGLVNREKLSVIEPGKVYQYGIRFSRGTGNLFRPGHRIRVEISSSCYPDFLPNLNTGADNLAMVTMSEAVVARQTVHHGRAYPSHILLPVIPTRASP